MLVPEQCRAARGLLNWTQVDLHRNSEVGLSTIRSFEAGQRNPIRANLAAIKSALEAAGVEFTNGGQPGVRMRREAKC